MAQRILVNVSWSPFALDSNSFSLERIHSGGDSASNFCFRVDGCTQFAAPYLPSMVWETKMLSHGSGMFFLILRR